MAKYKVGDTLTTKAGFTHYEVETVHDDGTITVVEAYLGPTRKPYARRGRVPTSYLLPVKVARGMAMAA